MPSLTCPICLDVLKAACETNCGHAFCAECILALPTRQCPVCRTAISSCHPSFTLRQLADEERRSQDLASASADEIQRLDREVARKFTSSMPNVQQVANNLNNLILRSRYGKPISGLIIGFTILSVSEEHIDFISGILIVVSTYLALVLVTDSMQQHT